MKLLFVDVLCVLLLMIVRGFCAESDDDNAEEIGYTMENLRPSMYTLTEIHKTFKMQCETYEVKFCLDGIICYSFLEEESKSYKFHYSIFQKKPYGESDEYEKIFGFTTQYLAKHRSLECKGLSSYLCQTQFRSMNVTDVFKKIITIIS